VNGADGRNETIRGLDGRLAEYSELIPKWERKMEEERRIEEAARKRQQQSEIERINRMASAMVAEAHKELELERAAKASVEFSVAAEFEDKARASNASADILEAERERYRVLVPTLQQQNKQLHDTVQRLRSNEMEHRQAAMAAEQ
jgi:hypothetical protein